MRCRLKCHNERNPYPQLPSGHAGHSVETAGASREEGGDDVKSARPSRPGPHTCYNGGHSGAPGGDAEPIPKARLSSDRSLQPDSVKLDSLVIAHQPWRGEYVPGPCTHRPSSHGSLQCLKLAAARSDQGQGRRLGLSRNKVAVPEGAAGTPPFWSGRPRGRPARRAVPAPRPVSGSRRSPVPLVRLRHPPGGLAQLARAPALQAGGQRFESVILHETIEVIDMLETLRTSARSPSKFTSRESSGPLARGPLARTLYKTRGRRPARARSAARQKEGDQGRAGDACGSRRRRRT